MPDVPEATPLPEKDLKYTPRQRENQTVVPIGRTPPNDVAAEQGVLGCVLLDPQQNLPACIEKVKDETVFYDLRHQAIYAAMVAMYEETAPIDLLTLSHQLRSAGELDNIGGVAYLTELQDSVPSAANLEYYFEIVRDQALLRRMIQTCTKAIADAYDETGEVDRLVGEVEQAVLAINRDHNVVDMPKISEHVRDAVAKIELLFKNKGSTTGVETGFTDLDKMTTGLHPGEMIVVAARPSMGKTSLAMNIEHVALDAKLPVGVFSLEMSSESLVMRMISSLARINSHDMQDGMLTPQDFPRITDAAGRLANSSCTSTTRLVSPSFSSPQGPAGCGNSTASSCLSLTTYSCFILLRGGQERTASRRSQRFPVESRPWLRRSVCRSSSSVSSTASWRRTRIASRDFRISASPDRLSRMPTSWGCFTSRAAWTRTRTIPRAKPDR